MFDNQIHRKRTDAPINCGHLIDSVQFNDDMSIDQTTKWFCAFRAVISSYEGPMDGVLVV